MIKSIPDSWLRFWFTPLDTFRVVPLRIAMCGVVIIWLTSFWQSTGTWFGEQGLLPTALGGKLIAFDESPPWQNWSPLWWTDDVLFYKLWLAAGIGLALLVAAGVGGRLTVAFLVLAIIAWAHRILWLSSLVEPALVAGIAYLLVEPGPNLLLRNPTTNSASASWTTGTTLRLIQTHWWLLVASTVVSQLAGIIWWRGEAVWWLAAAGQSAWLSREYFRDNAELVNLLTHGFILVEMLALWLITTKAARTLGIAFGLMASLAIGCIANQLLYAILLACFLIAFGSPLKRTPTNRE